MGRQLWKGDFTAEYVFTSVACALQVAVLPDSVGSEYPHYNRWQQIRACLEVPSGSIMCCMKPKLLFFAMLMAALIAAVGETGQTAKVLSVKKHPQGRIAHWEGRTPVFDGNPVYDITLQWNHKNYVVRYESITGYYPRAWEVGNEIQVKHGRGQFILYRGDEEIPAREISSHDCVQGLSPEGPASVTPQVPCD